MATPKVNAAITASWVDIGGAAASTAGVTWQNIGSVPVLIAFSTSAPTTDAVFLLNPGAAFYDKTGSAHVWAKTTGGQGGQLCAVAD